MRVQYWLFIATALHKLDKFAEADGSKLRSGFIDDSVQASSTEASTLRQLAGTKTIAFVGNNGSPPESFPLQQCQGDCDVDDDCADSLVCFQRTDEPVPGCDGTPGFDADFCVDPADIVPTAPTSKVPRPTPPPISRPPIPPAPEGYSGPRFRLRMYWRPEFMWQNTTEEFQYCVECATCMNLTNNDLGLGCFEYTNMNNPICYPRSQIWLQKCNGWLGGQGNSLFNLDKFDGFDKIRVDGTNLCLTRPLRRFVRLEECDPNNEKQEFLPMDITKPFEIHYFHDSTSERCLSIYHHPKEHELIYMEGCRWSRKYNSNLWEALLEN